MEDNTYSSMICAYLDGELDVTNEAPMFGALAANSELRTEMREYLSIRSAIFTDAEAYTPPPTAAHAIFGGVGLTYPAAAPPEEKRRAAAGFWLKYGRPATAALLFSAITAGASAFWYGRQIAALTAAATHDAPGRAVVVLQSAPASDAPPVPVAALPAPRRAADRPAKFAAAFPPEAVQQRMISAVAPPETMSQAQSPAPSVAPVEVVQPPQNQPAASVLPSVAEVRNASGSFRPVEIYPRFWVQTRGISMMASSPSPLPGTGVSPFDNLAVGAAYSLSQTVSIGVEGGREYYPLQFSGTAEGAAVTYRQVAPLAFGGLTAQFSMNPLRDFGGAAPFLALSGGGTEIGPYARATAGVMYPLTDSFGMTLGGDLSAVFFDFQQRSFRSWKAGLTAGFTFQF